jgi:AcrR family transcriptional regulator
VLARDGVTATTPLRAVAAAAQVSIGTLYYIFPAKEQMITAVLEGIRDEVSAVFQATQTHTGLAHALRHGLENYWKSSS